MYVGLVYHAQDASIEAAIDDDHPGTSHGIHEGERRFRQVYFGRLVRLSFSRRRCLSPEMDRTLTMMFS
jgi:hypothetical protein